MNIKQGSRWTGGDRKVFTVISVVELEGHTWVHYRDDTKEYSCYQESFLSRFTPLPD